MSEQDSGRKDIMETQRSQTETEASDSGSRNHGGTTTANESPTPRPRNENEVLKGLTTAIRTQEEMERDVNTQATQLLKEKANERDLKRLDRTKAQREKLQAQLDRLRTKLMRANGTASTAKITAESERLERQVKDANQDLEQIQARIDEREEGQQEEVKNTDPGQRRNGRLPGESRRDFLLRTGKITPFTKLPEEKPVREESTLHDMLLNLEESYRQSEEGEGDEEDEYADVSNGQLGASFSHQNLRTPGFTNDQLDDKDNDDLTPFEPPHKKQKLQQSIKKTIATQPKPPLKQPDLHEGDERSTATASKPLPKLAEVRQGVNHSTSLNPKSPSPAQNEDRSPSKGKSSSVVSSTRNTDDGSDGKDFEPGSDVAHTDDTANEDANASASEKSTKPTKATPNGGVDDGNEGLYQKRLKKWILERSKARARALDDRDDAENVEPEGAAEDDSGQKDEWRLPHPTIADTSVEGGLQIPGDIYPSLFDYQKTGVRWLWELYTQKVGGIVGDEMGLGKTIQIIALLASLHHSGKLTKPILIVTPATVMKQWVNEFHKWWPPFRVSILHSSGSGMVDVKREAEVEDDLLSRLPGSILGRRQSHAARQNARGIVNRVKKNGHILVTTYSGLQSYADLLIPTEWEYAVLDEGHKIRNPNIGITIYCKELKTPNRVILSGTPMQNNLVELWSLFDFVFPMRLGTLVSFRQQFEVPVRMGGYANANNLEVQTALKCAEILKDAISPYLLQRYKADVAADLPKKTEQVLFCKLTKPQREAYEDFLSSNDLKAIMAGKRQVLYGIDILRKICNHPDLLDHRRLSTKANYNYGYANKSGKMQIVKGLLEVWREEGHRTLLFAQHRIMLDILEKFIRSLQGFNYRRMDGTTPIPARQGMVDEFNKNEKLHVFLLTTKVGGLGVNLTGANRVIIFDPDWNPSTDVQARERAWRLGQKREVLIYRLMTSGTIEEKIYHRQLFKQFLVNKILRDPKERQTFESKDLHDLFTLGGANDNATETGNIFKGSERSIANQASTAEHGDGNGKGKASDDSVIMNLTGVSSLEHFQGGEEEDGDEPKPGTSNALNSESRVLDSIFARSGVHATIEHDQIVNGIKVIRADPRMTEEAAKKVAAEAAAQLKKAGELAKQVPIGVPTWTGQFGTGGRPGGRPGPSNRVRGGPASTSILAGLQNRQQQAAGQTSSRPTATGTKTNDIDFLKSIHAFFLTHGGQAHTSMLSDHFNRHCTTPQRRAEFRALLAEIAVMQKKGQGRGLWTLKDEYRT